MIEEVSPMISEEQIDSRLTELGKQIAADYAGKDIVLVGLLKGAVIFMADLARKIGLNVEMDFMTVSSYGAGTVSGGEILIRQDIANPVNGKHVLLVEDIIDTGRTIAKVEELLRSRNPASLRLCALLDKPSRREVEGIVIDYLGFSIPDAFVVGYGLDFDQRYRNLPYIGVLHFRDA